jgi:hypothetical protein
METVTRGLPIFLPDTYKAEVRTDLTSDQYHAVHTHVSSTNLRRILKSRKKFRAVALGEVEDEDKECLRFGNLAHLIALEPGEFLERYVVIPSFIGFTKDGRPSAQSADAKAQKAAWFADLPPGAIPISEEDMVVLTGMAQALASDKKVKGIMKDASFEQSIFYRDPVTGIACRVRVDILSANLAVLADYKTALAGDAWAFSAEIWKRRLDFQLAMYEHACEVKYGEKPRLPSWLVQEKKIPYECFVWSPDDAMLEIGRTHYRQALDRLAVCLDKDVWPGEQTKAGVIALPPYAMSSFRDLDE